MLEEVVVTAQKREQSVQDVPMSMTAWSGGQIRELGIDSTLDLGNFTPGLSIGQNSGEGDFPFISLRGVSVRDFADINESPSAVYIDEFYKANLQGLDAQIFDLQRVEVLRGPQGTLYGRNATGGLIHYVTAKPSQEFDAYGEFTVGERDRYKFEGAVGGGITDTLSGRLSVLYHRFDGYVENLFPGADDGSALDANSVRAQLLFEPNDDVSMSLFVQRSANDNDAGNMFPHVAVIQDPDTGLAVANPGGTDIFGFSDPTPNDPRNTNSDRDISLQTEQWTGIGRIEVDFRGVNIVSITGWEKTSKDAFFDSDGTPNARGTEVHPRAEQFSQEVRVSGETGNLNWLLGYFYFDYDVGGVQSRCAPGTCDALRPPVFYDLSTQSWAWFANGDYQFHPQWSLTLGVRYTDEEKQYALDNQNFGSVFNVFTVGSAAVQNDDNMSFNARLNWTPADNILAYAGVSRGHKAGTFNVGYTPIAFDAISVRPEELTSYEIGIKSELGERYVLNAAVFHYDYEDSQAFQFDGQTLSATAFNRDATITGAELEFSGNPFDGFTFWATMTYLDATLEDVERPGVFFTGLPPVDTDMPLAPDLK
ncbi:MAG: TonB-dependent receptor, partial [Gammaproteobacteria bacterium]|nr:TonB-dependent receptor [Gammaproteobacteria bacterium]